MSGSPTLFDTGGGGGSSNPLTTTGDMIYSSSGTTQARLPIGTQNQKLEVINGIPAWVTDSSSGINYIAANPNAETDTSGWATYFDAAANVPVDGTGGTATNLTFSRSTSTPLRGTASFSLAQANSTSLQGKGVSFDFTIDPADQAKPLAISFDYNASSTFVASNGITAPLNDGTTSTNAGNSDIEVFLYDKTNAVLIPVSPQVLTGNGTNNFRFYGTFQTASNSTSYRLIFHVASTSANATGWTVKYDNVYVGPQVTVTGVPSSDWNNSLSWTWTGLGTVGTTSVWTQRVGDTMNVRGFVTSGTATATPLKVALPSGYVIDSTKFASTSSVQNVGLGVRTSSATNNLFSASTFGFTAFYDGSDTASIYFGETTTSQALDKNNASASFGSGVVLSFFFSVPIVGWSSTTQMSNTTDTRIVDLVATNSAGSATANTALAGWTTVKDSHGAFNGTTYTVPVAGDYEIDFYAATTSGTPKAQIRTGGNLYLLGVGSGVRTCASTVISGLVPGNTITVSLDSTLTITTSTTDTVLAIRRISGPSAIAATETVSARYFASATVISGSLATIVWTTKDYDDHTGMSSGVYTIPSSGKYLINSSVRIAATFAAGNLNVLEIQKNSSVVSRDSQNAGGVQSDICVACSDIINCLAGDTIRVQVSSAGTTPTVVSSNFDNFFSIVRVGN